MTMGGLLFFLTSSGEDSTTLTNISNKQQASEACVGAIQLSGIWESIRRPRMGQSEVLSKLSTLFLMKLDGNCLIATERTQCA